MRGHFIGAFCVLAWAISLEAKEQNETAAVITDPFEEDEDLRFAADQFCREYTLVNPTARRISLPYKPDCHFWWQCTTYQLKKHECQGLQNRITLHYDLYLDRCEMPDTVKCNYAFDEEEIIMEHIMEFYKKQEPEMPEPPKPKA